MSVFYGWKISALSLAGNFMLQGSVVYVMNAFMDPLCAANGWTRMGLNFSLGLSALMGQIAMPLAAAISARYSLRFLMGFGALAGGVATCGMGITSDLRLFTIFYIIVWVSSQFCGGVVGNALMSNWFSHYRGIAFGIANSGTSISGMILPFLALIIINRYGVAAGYMGLGIATICLAPLSWIIVRRSPKMLHLHVDGRKHDPRTPKNIPSNVSLRALIKRPAPWAIGIAYGFALMVASGILSQLKPRLSDIGLDDYTGIMIVSMAALSATAAKYFWGWVCDRTSPIFASRALMLCLFTSLFLIFLPANVWTLALFGIFFSGSSGGLWVGLPAVVAYYFGSSNFLNVYKFVSIFILLRSVGFPIMGVSHEYFSSYAMADITFAACLLISFILTLFLRPERAVEKMMHLHHHK